MDDGQNHIDRRWPRSHKSVLSSCLACFYLQLGMSFFLRPEERGSGLEYNKHEGHSIPHSPFIAKLTIHHRVSYLSRG